MSQSDSQHDAVLANMYRRRSVRKFKPDAVPDDVIRDLVEAACIAPAGGNVRVCRFMAIRNRETLSAAAGAVTKKVADIRGHVSSGKAQQRYDGYTSHFAHFGDAPCVIGVVAKEYDSIYSRIIDKYVPEEARPEQHLVDITSMNIAVAIENLLLAATSKGYGACFMTGPMVAQKELETLLGVEDPWHLVALVPVGIPRSDASEKPKPSLEDVLSMD